MPFFEDSTVQDTVQATIEKVDSLEEKEQKRLLKAFRRVRRDLQDRLLTIPEGTFSEQQLNVTLVQVQAAIEAIKQDLKRGMVNSAEILADRGISDLISEVSRFEKKFTGSVQPLNIDRVIVAQNTNNFLVNKYEASLDAYGESLRADITQNIINSLIARDTTQRTVSRMTSDIGKFFQGEEWKLNRIVRTELHNVYNLAKMNTMLETRDQTLPDLKKTLMHPIDDRTGQDSKTLARRNPVVDVDQPFRFTFKGDERVFMFPPDRPNDRAILVPYRGEWNRKAAFIPRRAG